MTNAVFYAAFAVFLLAVLRSMLRFDLLLKQQYQQHRQSWFANGCPPGFLWMPEGTHLSLRGYIIRGKHHAELLFRTPAWLETDGERCVLRGFRWWSALAAVSGIALVALARAGG